MPTPNVTTMKYDALGRKTEMNDPDMGRWYYYYDTAGNLIAQVDARNQASNFYYDALNRLRGKTYATTTTPATYARPADPGYSGYAVKYYYDESGYGYSKGYRTRTVDANTNTAWTYNARGRVTQESKTISGNQFYTTYTYDALDRVVTMTYPDGEVVQSTYNAAGQPASLRSTTYNNYPYVNSATYNARGQQLTLGYGNSLTTAYDYYDGAGEPFSMRLQHLTVSSDRLDLTYQYDAVGNVTRLQDQSAAISETLTFTYDALDRLLTVRGAYNATYVYNTIGNLTSSTDLGTLYYLAPAHAHAATHVGGTLATHLKYTYDANGSMFTRSENGATYTQGWNQENRLQTVTVNGTTTTFTYDGDGVLVKKVIGNATTYYVGPHFEKTASPEVVTQYYTFGGQRVAMRVCNGSNGSCGTTGVNSTLTYLHSDHLGSASLATNSTGGVVSSMRYTAYGLVRPGGTMVTDRRFTGQRYEAGLGLYDYNARYYDPALGRFVQADSIVPGAADGAGGGAATLGYDSRTRLTLLTVNLGEFAAQVNEENREVLQFGPFFQWDSKTRQQHNVPMGPANPQALNRYAYCLNNPLRYVDPTGHYNFTMDTWAAYASRIETRIHSLQNRAYWVGGIGGAIGGGIITGLAEVATHGAATPFAAGIFAFSAAAIGIPLGLMAGGADAMAIQAALDYINTAANDLNAMGITEFELDIQASGAIVIRYCKTGSECDGLCDPYSYYEALDNVAPDLSIFQVLELDKILSVPLPK